MTIPAVAAQMAIQIARVSEWPMNGTPVTIWWAKASASPR